MWSGRRIFIFFIICRAYSASGTSYNNGRCQKVNGRRYFRTNLGFQACSTNSCPPFSDGDFKDCHVCCVVNVEQVNGSWSDWSSWTYKSLNDGGCIKSRDRSCSQPVPSGDGLLCLTQNGTRSYVESQLRYEEGSTSSSVQAWIGPLAAVIMTLLLVGMVLGFLMKKKKLCFKRYMPTYFGTDTYHAATDTMPEAEL